MRLFTFLSRLWSVDKLGFISLVLMAGLLPLMILWAVDAFPHTGWRIVFYPLAMTYFLYRFLEEARERVARGIVHRDAHAPFDQRLKRAFRDGSIRSGHVDDLIRDQIAADEAYRLKLWAEAASNPKAARRLRESIQAELDAVDEIIRYNVEHRPEDQVGLQDLALLRKEKEQDLQRAAEFIRQLRE